MFLKFLNFIKKIVFLKIQNDVFSFPGDLFSKNWYKVNSRYINMAFTLTLNMPFVLRMGNRFAAENGTILTILSEFPTKKKIHEIDLTNNINQIKEFTKEKF